MASKLAGLQDVGPHENYLFLNGWSETAVAIAVQFLWKNP